MRSLLMAVLLLLAGCSRPAPWYVADGGNDRILRMDRLGGRAQSFGDTRFRQPSDVAVDRQGRIYVVDRLNRRLVRMDDMEGGGWKEVAGPFEDPLRLAIHPGTGEVFVTDFARGRVLRFPASLEGEPRVYDDGSQVMQKPSDVAFDRLGRLYVTNDESSRLLRISDLDDLDGSRGTWEVWDGAGVPGPIPGLRGMGAVAIGPDDRVYVVSMAGDHLVRLEPDLTGPVVFGRRGSGVGEFYDPRDVTFDEAGRLLVVDAGNGRLVRLDDITGKGWTEFEPGLRWPWAAVRTGGLEVDGVAPRPSPIPFVTTILDPVAGHEIGEEQEDDEGVPGRPPRRPPPGVAPGEFLVVADTHNHRLAFLSRGAGGPSFDALGSKGTGPLQFCQPTGMAVDLQGRLLVVDSDNRRLVRIDDPSGAGWTEYRSVGGENDQSVADPAVPHAFDLVDSVAVEPGTGRIFFSDTNNHRIVRIDDMTGAGWTTYSDGGLRFRAPAGLAFGPDGALYAVSTDVEYRVVRIEDLSDHTGRTWEFYDGSDLHPFPRLRDAAGLAVAADGTVYASDPSTDRVLAVNPEMEGGRAFGAFGVGEPGRFFAPLGLAASPEGLLAVVDSGNNRVAMLDPRRSEGDRVVNWWDAGTPGSGDWNFRAPSHAAFWSPPGR